ncbi:MAG TPA: ABC transporter ATP-binding protein [Verrucomicrobiota bacterium]|nr:ABC transporter ATP-binding protein [Verrucomicrobiota bacterium]
MTNETLVNVDNVRKKFCRSLKRSLWYGLSDMASEVVGGKDHEHLRKDEFWAVNRVSFELRRGECLGLIGRNGAGKTTLLKMLNGLIKPDEGRIEMHGRVGALIALGAGFNPILTGRENIYVNGSVLGLTKKEIDDKMEAIIDFAEIRDFIDTPVQSYSSGMQVRLGFSVASSLAPDVLILDEVLAVGDINFTIKCLNRMRSMAARAAVIFVSHNMQLISSFCNRVIVLKGGTILTDSTTSEGINCYYSMIEHARQESGTGDAVVHEARMINSLGLPLSDTDLVKQGETITVEIDLSIHSSIKAASIGIHILDQSMTAQVISFPIKAISGAPSSLPSGRHRLRVPLGPLELNAGKYSFMLSIADTQTRVILLRLQGICPFKVYSDSVSWSQFIRPVTAVECDIASAPITSKRPSILTDTPELLSSESRL